MEAMISTRGGEHINPMQERIRQLGLRMYESFRNNSHPYRHFHAVEIPYQGIIWLVRYWPPEDEGNDKLEVIRDIQGTAEAPTLYAVGQNGNITKSNLVLRTNEQTLAPHYQNEEVTDLEEAQILRTMAVWAQALRRVDL